MRLLPGDIVLIHRGTGWMIFAPLVWLWQWAVGPYHVELAWNPSTDNIFTSLSMQPPVLDVVERWFSDIKIKVYRLKDRPHNLDEMLYKWANDKIGKELYILGWNTCGMLPRDFYRDVVGVPCTNSPYPGAIEKFCWRSEKFTRVI